MYVVEEPRVIIPLQIVGNKFSSFLEIKPFEQIECTIHHRDFGVAHCANVEIVVLASPTLFKILCENATSEPARSLKDFILDSKMLEDHGGVKASYPGSDNTNGQLERIRFWCSRGKKIIPRDRRIEIVGDNLS